MDRWLDFRHKGPQPEVIECSSWDRPRRSTRWLTGRARLLVPLTACLSLLLACSSGGGARQVGKDPIIAVHGSNVGSLGTVRGTLEYDPKTKCLFLQVELAIPTDTQTQVFPVWPKRTKPITHEGRRGVFISGEGRFLEGDPIDVAGRHADPDAFQELDIPADCRKDGFVIINQD